MKNNIIVMLLGLFIATSCADLDLAPLSSGGSDSWYSSESEIQTSINGLYAGGIWKSDDDSWTDNWTSRTSVATIPLGSVSSTFSTAKNWWEACYKGIRRANIIIQKLEEGSAVDLPIERVNRYIASAKFVRAKMYSDLITHFGDVIFYTDGEIDFEDSFSWTRVDKETILTQIYEDYDFAIETLPKSYSNLEIRYATKGTAMAYKARTALYNGDWGIARDASKACIDLDLYSLHSNYGDYFLSKTKNSKETIFSIPRSVELDVTLADSDARYPTQAMLPRNNGGWGAYNPSWELLSSYTCVDGLPIDESPLYDPRNPFQNRDPRCAMTIVEFGSTFLGVEYDPKKAKVMDYNKGREIKNLDSSFGVKWASFNGLLWKKAVDEDWLDLTTDPDRILMRYADVLLMYAESRMELGEITQEDLDLTINEIRKRAYTSSDFAYPKVTETDQAKLRTIIRTERRVELANEDLRYMDLIRWRIAETVLTRPIYGNLLKNDWKSKVIDQGLYFFPSIPEIDENGSADFTAMSNTGLIRTLGQRSFDKTKQYLWPIPDKEIQLSISEGNSLLKQNPGY